MIRNTKRMFSGTLVLNGNADRQTDDCWPWRESIVAWHKPSETGTSTRRTDLYLCDAFVRQRAESGTRAHARLRRVLRGEGAEDAASCTNTSTALITPYSCCVFSLNPEASCLTCSVCVGFTHPFQRAWFNPADYSLRFRPYYNPGGGTKTTKNSFFYLAVCWIWNHGAAWVVFPFSVRPKSYAWLRAASELQIRTQIIRVHMSLGS